MMAKSKEIIFSSDKLTMFIQKYIGIDLSGMPNLLETFSKKHELNSINGHHIGLMSSDNLKDIESDAIVGIWLQGIDPELDKDLGRVAQHSHGDDNIDEIIILDKNSHYAGLTNCIGNINGYKIFWVPAGLIHGSNEQPSFGRWISIKVKSVGF